MLNMGLGFVFSAQDFASGAMRGLERNFMSLDKRVGLGTSRIQSSFQQLGMGMSLLGTGAVMLGGAFALANAAGEFEQAVAAVAAVSGATADELTQLKDAAIQAGIATQFSPTEAVQGLKELAQAGFDARDSIKLLNPTLDLAAGSLGELTPQGAAGLVSQALKAFGVSADGAGLAVDQMLQSVNLFALNAGELPMSLGIVSRGAQALKQSMGETLATLGLVKNVIPGIERASTGVAVAMERLADTKVQRALRGINVEVTDSNGRFRNFLDVIGDMIPGLSKMTDAKRASFLIDTFGAHALGSMQAVMTQLTNGIKNNAGEVLKGADAVKYLRESFEDASGTAAAFKNKMLDTFAGQKKLLSGSMQTLAIVMGEPLIQVFKPIVSSIATVVNAMIGVFRAMPASVQKAFATFVVGSGTVLSLVGAFVSLRAMSALAAVALKALGLSFGGLLATLGTAISGAALLALLIGGFVVAFQHNVGGIGDAAQALWNRVSLAFRGLSQLFSDGSFSGAVMEELNRAENLGLKRFIISVFVFAGGVNNFFRGFGRGFEEGFADAKPAIDAFVAALNTLGQAFGFVTGIDPNDAKSRWFEFGRVGEWVGSALSGAFSFVVDVLTGVLNFFSGLVDGFSSGFDSIEPAISGFTTALSDLGESLGFVSRSDDVAESTSNWTLFGEIGAKVGMVLADVFGVLANVMTWVIQVAQGVVESWGFVTAGWEIAKNALGQLVSSLSDSFDYLLKSIGLVDGAGSSWAWLGSVISFTIGVIEAAIGIIVSVISAAVSVISAAIQMVIDVIHGIVDVFNGVVLTIGSIVTGDWANVWTGMKLVAFGVIDAIVGAVLELAGAIAGVLDAIGSLFGADLKWQSGLRAFKDFTHNQMRADFGLEGLTASGQRDLAAVSTAPQAAAAAAAASAVPAAAIASLPSPVLYSEQPPQRSVIEDKRQTTIQLQVDGQTLATAVHNADKDAAARGFSPVPSY
jgi:TP901 family phage tail tape measure protein